MPFHGLFCTEFIEGVSALVSTQGALLGHARWLGERETELGPGYDPPASPTSSVREHHDRAWKLLERALQKLRALSMPVRRPNDPGEAFDKRGNGLQNARCCQGAKGDIEPGIRSLNPKPSLNPQHHG